MKEKFIKSTIILMIGGCLTKVLGMIIKIVMSRLMGTTGLGLYMLVLPTFSLFIGLAQFGFPIAVSKLVAEDTKNNKKLVFSLIPLSLVINLLIMIFIFIVAPILSKTLLHEPRSYFPILAIALVLPLTSLSGILRSYFFGKQQMLPHVVSNVTEDIIRLILVSIGIPLFLKKGIEFAVTFVILSNIISEFTSIVVLFFFLPRHFKLSKSDFKVQKDYTKEALSISVPNTASRLVSSTGYFLEPIILTSVLLGMGYTNEFILHEYGVISGYVLPLLLLPSFFTNAISQALLPVVSRSYSRGQVNETKRKIKQAIFFSLLIGVPVTLFFLIAPTIPLKLIYHTGEGISYMRFLAPICLFQYIQSPLSFSLEAMGKSKENLKITLSSVFVRTFFLFVFSCLHIGMWGLILATSCNVLFTTFYSIRMVQKMM